MTSFPDQPRFRTSADPRGPRWLLEEYSAEDPERCITLTIPKDEALTASSAPKEARATSSEWHTSPAAFLVYSYMRQKAGQLPEGTYTEDEPKKLLRRMLTAENVGWVDRMIIRLYLLGSTSEGPWGSDPPAEIETGLPDIWHTAIPEESGGRRARYVTQELLRDYTVPTKDGPITVYEGFTYDMASIPESLWSVAAPNALSHAAPLVHDFFYRHEPEKGSIPDGVTYSRKDADKLFLELMEKANVPPARRRVAYAAVRTFAGLAWRKNRREANARSQLHAI